MYRKGVSGIKRESICNYNDYEQKLNAPILYKHSWMYHNPSKFDTLWWYFQAAGVESQRPEQQAQAHQVQTGGHPERKAAQVSPTTGSRRFPERAGDSRGPVQVILIARILHYFSSAFSS